MDTNEKLLEHALRISNLHDDLLGEIDVNLDRLNKNKEVVTKSKTEMDEIVAELRAFQPKAERPNVPEPKVEDDIELSTLSLSEKATGPLAALGVTKLSQLARCRKDDINELAGLTPGSRKAIYRLLEEKGITLRDGRSFVETLKLLREAAAIVPSGDLEQYGHVIGYVAGSKYAGRDPEFSDTPKLYFQAYDKVIQFLAEAGAREPRLRLKEFGFPSF